MENRTLVTESQLSFIMQRPVSVEVTKELNDALNRYKINTKNRIRHFLTQIGYESQGLHLPYYDGTLYCWDAANLNQKVDDGWSVKALAEQLPTYNDDYYDLQLRYSYYNRCIEAIK